MRVRVLLVLLLSGLAWPGGAVTLTELQQLAIAHSKELQSFAAQTQADRALIREETARRLPQLTGTLDAGWDDSVGGWQATASANISWDLAGLASPPSDAAFRVQKDLWQTRSFIDKVKLEVALSWSRLSVLVREQKEDTKLVKFFKDHLVHLELLKAEGVDSSWDILRVKNQLSTLLTSQLRETAEVQNLLALLRSVTGVKWALSSLRFLSSSDLPSFEPNVWYRRLPQILASRPELHMSEADVQAAQAMTERARLAWLPQVKLSSAIQPTQLGPNRRWGLAVDFPLWDAGAQTAIQESLQSTWKAQKAQAEALREKQTLELETLIRETSSARQLWESAEADFHNAELVLKEAQSLYQEGRLKEVDVLSAALDWENARTQVTDAERSFGDNYSTLVTLYGQEEKDVQK